MNACKTVLITGATSGMGLCAAIKLNDLGYSVIASGRDEEKLEVIKEKYGIDVLKLDVSMINEIKNKVGSVKSKYNTIDYLINCAGIGLFGRIEDLSDQEIEECVNVNLLGTMIVTKYVSKIMVSQRSGHIITVESLASDSGIRCGEVYSATKAGISMFNSVMEKELRKKMVKMTSIKPGLVNTKLVENIKQSSEEILYGLVSEDVVNAIVFAIIQSSRANVSEIKLRPFDIRGQTLFQDLLDKKYSE